MLDLLLGRASRGKYGVQASDLFNRADSAVAIGTSTSGHVWAVTGGTWGISSNQLYCAVLGTANDCATLDAGLTDCIVQGRTTQNGGLVLRVLNAGTYLGFRANSGANYTIVSRVAAVETVLATIAQVPVNGDFLEARLRGQVVDFWINGVYKTSVADPQYATRRTKHGFRAVNITQRYDDFKIIGW